MLLLLSIITTTGIGARFMQNYHDGLPLVAHESDLWPWPWLLQSPARFLLGWPFSVALLSILLTHEFGHYIACRLHSVDCTLPWVLPAPTLSGTLGAIIRLRGRIPDRRVLIDIGVWGPIAGYVVSIAAAMIGMSLSLGHVTSYVHSSMEIVNFSPPSSLELLRSMMEHLFLAHRVHANVSVDPAVCHPILLAAWIGLFITSLNLIPCGQLDGGHILYAISPHLHRIVSRVLPVVLLVAAWYCWVGWAVWGIILLIPAMRHPRVLGDAPPGAGRKMLAVFAMVIFALTITSTPFPGNAIRDLFLSQ